MTIKLDAHIIEAFTDSFLLDSYDEAQPVADCHRQWWNLACSEHQKVAFAAPRGHAKAQPLTEVVLTPNGWTQIGLLQKGDYVIGSNGEPTRVITLHPVDNFCVYEVSTVDGRKARCNGEHLWKVSIPSNTGMRQRVMKLYDIMRNYKVPRFDKRNGKEYLEYRYRICLSEPVQWPERELLIDPYVLGVWLGDGHSAGSRITSADPEIFSYFPAKNKATKQSGKYLYGVTNLGPQLRQLGVLNNKHVPANYLRSSIEQRLALVQGLMDTDGTAHCEGNISYFCNTNQLLIEQFIDLVRGFGGVAGVCSDWQQVNGQPYASWRVSVRLPGGLSPFRLKRKRSKLTRKEGPRLITTLTEIRSLGVQECRCISVEAKDGLYLTRDYLPTHNSTAVNHAYGLAASLFEAHPFQLKVSKTYALACEKVEQAKQELLTNDKIRGIFRIDDILRDRENDFIAVTISGYKFRMMALGMGQATRGLSWGTMRPTLILCHEAGTRVEVDGKWMLNQQHPSAKIVAADCRSVSILWENDEEVVSADHFYLAKNGVEGEPRWIRARDLTFGDFIADPCTEGAQERILARVAGTQQRAIAGEESRLQQAMAGVAQRTGGSEKSATQYVVSTAAQGQYLSAPEEMARGKSRGGSRCQTKALSRAQGTLRRVCQAVLARASRAKAGTYECAAFAFQVLYSVMGGSRCHPGYLSASEKTWDVSGSYRSDSIGSCLRVALPAKFANPSSSGKYRQAESFLAEHVDDGFRWRPVVSVRDVGRKNVVALWTKSGFYKTKFGMSHNCDDI